MDIDEQLWLVVAEREGARRGTVESKQLGEIRVRPASPSGEVRGRANSRDRARYYKGASCSSKGRTMKW